jgi:predicted tellurium resistance membrane protein TerC
MWGKLSLLGFFISLVSLTFLSLGISIGIPYWVLFYGGVVLFGIIGFVSSVLSSFFDRNKRKINKAQALLFYLGMILVFAGLMFKMMHWPFTNFLLFGGIIASTISFFIPNFERSNSAEELLDDEI